MAELMKIDTSRPNGDLVDFLRGHVNPFMSKKTYAWQYTQIPEGALFHVASDGGQLICTQSFLPYKMVINGEKRLTAKSENSFLSPDFRGTTIFKDVYTTGLKDCHVHGMDLIWGFTPAVKVWKKKLEFETFDQVIYDYRFTVNAPAFNTMFEDIKGPLRYLKRMADYVRGSRLKKALGKSIEDGVQITDHLPEGVALNDLLSDAIATDSTVRLDMEAAFLDWRVHNNPTIPYRTRFLMLEGNLAGYYILGQPENSSCGQLVDFVFRDESTASQLLYDLLAYCQSETPLQFVEYFGNRANVFNNKIFNFLASHTAGKFILNQGMALVLKTPEPQTYPVESFFINGLWTEGYYR